MAIVTFGDYSADMRFQDEGYLLPWFQESLDYIDAFEAVRENVLNESAVQYKVLQFDADDQTLTITIEGDIDAGSLDLMQIEALGVLQSITGSFVVDQFGDLDGTATGMRVDAYPGLNGDLQLLVDITNVDIDVRFTDSGNDTDLLAGADIISGGSGDDYLLGYAGADSISGGAGNDTLSGDTGADTLVGGAGNDTYLADALDTLRENSGEGSDTVVAGFSHTLAANFENLLLTGAQNLAGTGNSLANTLTGNTGNNLLAGGAGNDNLKGAAGADTLKGGGGHDILLGGAGDDSLLGGMGNDSIAGYDGSDTLQGWLGSDTLEGGRGDDTYVAEADDVLVEYSGAGTDTVKTANSFTLANHFENLVLTGGTAIDGHGNSLANSIIGNSGNNVLEGAAGNDLLKGAGGADTLNGGIGNDTLLGGIGADRLIYDSTSGALYYDADGTGEAAAIQFAALGSAGHPLLSASDFVIAA